MTQTGGRVAIVEDDAAMRKSIERLLAAGGFKTVAFGSAEEFLAGGIWGEVKALVLDIHLGGMSGIDLRLRLQTLCPTLPVIFMTAYDDDAMRAQALATGCVDYLQKPFEAHHLFQALHKC